MILKNSLYTISRKQELPTAVVYDLRLHADHPIYRAHFPGEPVTPGVCIVQMACELLADHLGRPLRLTAVKNVKFLAVLSPLEHPAVTYTFSRLSAEADGSVHVQATVADGDTPLAKISATLANN